MNPEMNTEPHQVAPPGQNLFWVLLAVFVVLALDAAFRLSDLLVQRSQLDQARFVQAQNIGKLAEGQQAQTRLQALSYEVVLMAATNEGARKIVQDFNIRFNPNSPASLPVAAPISQPPASSNPPPASTSLLSTSNNLLPAASKLTPVFSNPLTPAASNLPPAR